MAAATQKVSEELVQELHGDSVTIKLVDPSLLLPVVTTLIPLLIKCFTEARSAKQVQQKIRSKYKASSGKFNKFFLNRAMNQVRKSSEISSQALTDQQEEELATKVLLKAMNMPTDQLEEVMKEH
jgi:hypothetical protein